MADNQFDAVIRGAKVYDGTGAPPFDADVAISGDRIAAVGTITGASASEVDGRRLALAPGFIDVHTHDDFAVFVVPEMDFKVMQGVTSEIVGNCGFGAAPYDVASAFFRSAHGDFTLAGWNDYSGYLDAVDRDPPSLNIGILVGHGTLRFTAMGNAKREPTAQEMAAMRGSLASALEAGALGLSTGLILEPGCYAQTNEIVELAREVGKAGGIYASHMRNEAGSLCDAVRETIRIGAEASVAVEISHHKAAGRDNWGSVTDSLRLIEAARADGLDVTADQYPYTSASFPLAAVVTNNALNDRGREGGLGRVDADQVLIASAPHHPDYEGKTLAELGGNFGVTPEEAARRVVAEEGNVPTIILDLMDERDVRSVMRHPTTMIGSDGLLGGKRPHPRVYGTFARVLGHYARDNGVLSIEEAIHRMTGMAAEKFKLADRGVIREGAFADLVMFDPAKIIDTATHSDPRRYPEGISHVFVNGTAVIRNGRHTGTRPGRTLRRK